ncbi:MAG TPA: hypothetical protein DEV81_16880 [Cyanobacteria bacterium UBA11049]|nr:hypothetical protein [Cyanobacteria bacterium UBA11049]
MHRLKEFITMADGVQPFPRERLFQAMSTLVVDGLPMLSQQRCVLTSLKLNTMKAKGVNRSVYRSSKNYWQVHKGFDYTDGFSTSHNLRHPVIFFSIRLNKLGAISVREATIGEIFAKFIQKSPDRVFLHLTFSPGE